MLRYTMRKQYPWGRMAIAVLSLITTPCGAHPRLHERVRVPGGVLLAHPEAVQAGSLAGAAEEVGLLPSIAAGAGRVPSH